MRWKKWENDGANIYLADTFEGTVAVRAFNEEDAHDRIKKNNGQRVDVENIRQWKASLPYNGCSKPSAALDLDGVLWGLIEDRPYAGLRMEMQLCAGVEEKKYYADEEEDE